MSRRELAEPQKLLPVLLQPAISKLHPETVAVYVHAATKVFAFWAVETAKRWDNDDLPKVKQQVDYVVELLQEFATDPNIEVQERVSICSVMTYCISFTAVKGSEFPRALRFHKCRSIAVQTATQRELCFRQ